MKHVKTEKKENKPKVERYTVEILQKREYIKNRVGRERGVVHTQLERGEGEKYARLKRSFIHEIQCV